MKGWRAWRLFLLCGVLVWLLGQSGVLRAAAREAVDLCAKTVIPALFPFMVVSALLISLGFGEWIAPRLAGVMALFRLGGGAGSALLLGFVGGYPMGARTAAALCREGFLLRGEAERLLFFCNNASPVFFLSVAGPLFSPPRAGIALWLIHVLSALLTGLFARRRGKGRAAVPKTVAVRAVSFSAAFVRSVTESGAAMVSICGFVVFFYVVCAPLRSIGGPLGAAAVGFVELFSLTPLIKPDGLGFVTVSACAAWGGVSVMCQCAAALEEAGLSLGPLLKGKALHALFAALLAAAVWPFL